MFYVAYLNSPIRTNITNINLISKPVNVYYVENITLIIYIFILVQVQWEYQEQGCKLTAIYVGVGLSYHNGMGSQSNPKHRKSDRKCH